MSASDIRWPRLRVLGDGGAWLVSACGVAVALAGYAAARAIPSAAAASPGLVLDWNLWRSTAAIIAIGRANRPVWRAIMAISWFWTVGATVLSQFPVMAKEVLGAESGVVTLFLATFSIGIGVGSMLEARLLRGEVSLRHVPWAAFGISLFCLDFVLACSGSRFATIAALTGSPAGWRVLADLFGLAVCGGVFSVPLYALMQERSDAAVRSRVIATNNVMNAAFMVSGAIIAAVLTALGAGAPNILLVTALANLVALLVILRAPRD